VLPALSFLSLLFLDAYVHHCHLLSFPTRRSSDLSMNDGIMHACGHDAHTAILLGTAHLLHEQFVNGELEGTVKFIFQPAEEATDDYGLSGAPYMIKEGVLDDVDQVIALH